MINLEEISHLSPINSQPIAINPLTRQNNITLDNWPWRNITSLSHESTERKPETIEHGEVICEAWSALLVFDLPLVWTEPTDEEEDKADANVWKYDAHPDVIREWIHEREHSRFLLLRLLDHDADAKVHEWLREVNDSFAHWWDGQRCYGDVSFLT